MHTRSERAANILSIRRERNDLKQQAAKQRGTMLDMARNAVGASSGSQHLERRSTEAHLRARLAYEESRAQSILHDNRTPIVPRFREGHAPQDALTPILDLVADSRSGLQHSGLQLGSINTYYERAAALLKTSAPEVRTTLSHAETFAQRIEDVVSTSRAILNGMTSKRGRALRTLVAPVELPEPRRPSGSKGRYLEALLDTYEQNSDLLIASLYSNDKHMPSASLEALYHLLLMGNPLQRRLSSALLKQHVERIAKAHPLNQVQLLDVADTEFNSALSSLMEKNIESGTYTPDYVYQLFYGLLNDMGMWTQRVNGIGRELIHRTIAHYGFAPEKLLHMWDGTRTASDRDWGVYPRNISNMYALEQHQPQSTLRLCRDFGIMIFGRYPIEALRNQIDHIDDTTSPYGMFLAARFDVGYLQGAMYENTEMVRRLHQDLQKHGHLLRIAEASTRTGVVKRHLQLRNAYGPLGFGIHMAHGTPERMRYGATPESQSYVSMADLNGPSARAVTSTYREGAPHIFISCSTGQKDGIAHAASRLSTGNVIAPPMDISHPRIDVRFDEDNHPHFALRYSESSPPNSFFGGEHL